MAPIMNYLGTKGKKMRLQALYSDRETGQEQSSQLESSPNRCYGSETGVKRVASSSYSTASGSDPSESNCTPEPMAPAISSSTTAAKVLSELKEEVTRLIDQSIQKIELDWTQNFKQMLNDADKIGTPEPVPDMTTCVEDTAKSLHPDGDRGQVGYREQNLQVLQTEMFGASKRQTRIKLLNEVRDLVDRLKDMEMLEE
uniref:Uncharacterized protein n=1 Tax=Anopheles dirus TaxID=7168 RepID=A0A182N7R4_9DIPT